MTHPSTDVVYQLHIQLAYIEPPIWRRIFTLAQATAKKGNEEWLERKISLFCSA